jgi:hypothetical protein
MLLPVWGTRCLELPAMAVFYLEVSGEFCDVTIFRVQNRPNEGVVPALKSDCQQAKSAREVRLGMRRFGRRDAPWMRAPVKQEEKAESARSPYFCPPALIAQWLEQWTHNPSVAGSSPAGRTSCRPNMPSPLHPGGVSGSVVQWIE